MICKMKILSLKIFSIILLLLIIATFFPITMFNSALIYLKQILFLEKTYFLKIILICIFILNFYFLNKLTSFSIKLFLKKIFITGSVINTLISTLIISYNSIVSSLDISDKYKNTIILDQSLICKINIILISIVSLYYCIIFLFKNSAKIDKIQNKKIIIKFGDIWKIKKDKDIIVIPANTSFDTVFEGVISPKTLHGQAINKLINNNIDIEKEVREKINKLNSIQTIQRKNNKAHQEVYELGTCIELPENIVFMGFADLDPNSDRAVIPSLSKYTTTLLNGFNNIEKIKNNRNVVVPFFGTGNINLCSAEISLKNLLIYLIKIIQISDLNFGYQDSLTIVLYGMKDDISLYEIENLFNE